MCLADYEDYMAVHDVMSALYENREQWNQKSDEYCGGRIFLG